MGYELESVVSLLKHVPSSQKNNVLVLDFDTLRLWNQMSELAVTNVCMALLCD